MSRAVQCPSCGAQHEVHNPGITALNCEFCKTLIYWDAQAVHDSGVKAILDPPSSALRVGEPVTLKKREFTVLGRVRYSFGGGVWDEWFLEGADQKIVWLTEDEKEFALEQPVKADPAVPPFTELRVGAPVTVHDRPFMVEEVGRAACLGVEGQVPFVVIPNEVYPFADLVSEDGTISLGVEYDEAGVPSLFQGSFVAREELRVNGGAPFPEVSAGQSVRCPGCGAPQEGGHPADAEMLVCSQCGSVLALGGTEAKVVGKNREKVDFTLAVGNRGTFDKVTYEVVGRLHYVETDWGVSYVSDEYLLWNEKKGYLWLEESDHHFVLNKRSHLQPGVDLFSFFTAKDKVPIGDVTYRFVEAGETTLRYVDGALPWVATVGEKFKYADLIAPPLSFGAELSASGDSREIEFFEGRYLSTEEMAAAFKREFARPYGVAPSQPFSRTAGQRFLLMAGALFAIINLGLLVLSAGGGRRVMQEQISAEQYRGEHTSEPFAITKKPSVVEISGSAPLNNAWVSLDFGLVNASDEVCFESSDDASYYSGYEGGESWSEGSQSFSQHVRVDQPGTYRLIVFGAAGTGETADSAGGPPVTVEVREGITLSRYFLLMFILAVLYPLKEIARQYTFEAGRFPKDDDDDD